LSWPINSGKDFKGVYNLYDKSLLLFHPNQKGSESDSVQIDDLSDPALDRLVGEKDASQLREDASLIDGVYGQFENTSYLSGQKAPVFFGSAINNFGVKELLDTFIRISPNPQGRNTTERKVEALEDKFSGFIFKIHANLDPKHRDRIAFLRVCSGKFERNKFYHHVRLNKDVRFSNPYSFLARDKDVIEEAYSGDVVGCKQGSNENQAT
jgi:peptide chain release factor 3